MTVVTLLILVIVIVIVLGVVVAVFRSTGPGRRGSDGMSSFQRQIDALSPEARRPVVDQVKKAASDDDDGDDQAGRRRQAR